VHATVPFVLQQVQLKLAVGVPLPLLAELLAHERQLLARVAPHQTIIRPQIGELLPAIARHPAKNGMLPVRDFIMRQRKHKILGMGVEQAEGDAVVVPGAVHRLHRHVIERVVHPAHVPFQPEAEAAYMRGQGHSGPAPRPP
jgi:hypothetical protein